ncbi:MAG TPA: DMT family transporter, partial [Dongiaceae bacterium]|nr:DMT family transporter [Dongiaceae bacterium]
MSPTLVLVLAVLAVTYAGPVIRLATAPALAIAFWRLALVLPVTLALAWRERAEAGRWERPGRDTLLLMLLAGVLLALHFWTWIASLRFTSVASSLLLVSLKPLFVWAIAALWLGEHPGRRERWGIVLAVAGATLIGAGDARLSGRALAGDLLAVAGAVTVAGYYVIGRRVRQSVTVWRYVTPVYVTAALVLGIVAAATRAP